jgi:alkanesulfonate monooxygenase SsuD/methylene tetrahydromethanopterin reductase-like flavin-dependent oxidoreductase (luciferase family)
VYSIPHAFFLSQEAVSFMPENSSFVRLAIALEGAGWHPCAWRLPRARPWELFSAGYWTDLVREAEQGLADFVTIEDSLGVQSTHYEREPDAGETGRVQGRLDAVLTAARVAPLTRHIGLVPSMTVTHTEPFHASKAIATLDHISGGRAGVRVQISGRAYEAALFGRREMPRFRIEPPHTPDVARLLGDLFAEAGDWVEAVRRLWDSWEDDAEIRDTATGRFIDRDRLHYTDFRGKWFGVKGPSITPRPPQGQPLVTALAHRALPYRFGAQAADVVYATPADAESAAKAVEEIRVQQAIAGRARDPLHVFGDIVVFLGATEREATGHRERLEELAGAAYTCDAHVFTGTPGGLADLMLQWRDAGLSGFRLRPAALPQDLFAITRELLPELRRRGVFRHAYEAGTLRGLLGMRRPGNRYANGARSRGGPNALSAPARNGDAR